MNRHSNTGLTRAQRWFLVLATLAALSLALEFGFDLARRFRLQLLWTQILLAAVFFGRSLVLLYARGGLRAFLRELPLEGTCFLFFLLLGAFFPLLVRWGAFPAFAGIETLPEGYLLLLHGYLAANILLEAGRFARYVSDLRLSAPTLLVAGYLLVIGVGTVLLVLPRSSATGESIGFSNALFTSVSGVCVTGLTVIDVGRDLSHMGQWVLLGLIQFGGLGLATFILFSSLVLAGEISLRGTIFYKNALEVQHLAKAGRFLTSIFLTTALLEGFGTALFFLLLPESGLSTYDRFFTSLFHAVSAFCNAGFSLNADSLMRYRDHTGILMTFSFLIVVGGLGFPVIYNILKYRVLRSAFMKRFVWIYRWTPHRPEISRLSMQTKLVLWTSGILLAVGTVAFLLLESPYLYKEMGWGERIMTAFFQSVTCRTAGFNTVETSQLTNPTLFLLILFMAVGASPGSTGGGMKTSTFAIFLMSLWGMLRGHSARAYGRSVPRGNIERAQTVVILYVIVLSLLTFALSIVMQGRFLEILFEMTSAFATVGLSTGITTQLPEAGRFILVLAMFFGRLGPLTVVLAMGREKRAETFQYPPETVMVG